ncbi:hypothetical protein [uncultured Nitrospira sp.]|uniref:hypothetical protein n=1 Tax=uncultured Nitrospira sp. TaxID=157176 RepID=UPI0031403773
MNLFTAHKGWWTALAGGSLVVAFLTMDDLGIPGALGKAIGMMLVSLLVTGIPWLFYRIIKKPLTTTQIMSTVTVMWALFALSQFVASSSGGETLARGVVFHPEGCDYSVEFQAEPRYYTTQKALANGILVTLRGAELVVSDGRGLTRAECIAVNYDLNAEAQDDVISAMQQIALDLGLSRPDFAFEKGKLGAVATITGVKDTERGRIIARVTNYHGTGSIMTLYVTSLSADFQTSEMTRFGRSIRLH